MTGALHLTTAELLQLLEQWPAVEPLPPEPRPVVPVLSEEEQARSYEQAWQTLWISEG